jgi:phosphoglycolate phosphatase
MLKQSIRGILFDKDGTVLDFMHTWYPILQRFIREVASIGNLTPEQTKALAHDLGDRHGSLIPDSIYAHGSFQEILDVVQKYLPTITLTELGDAFRKGMSEDTIHAKPIGQAKETLALLHQRGYVLGIATADRQANAMHTLEEAGLDKSFDFIGTEDSVTNGKPAPDLMELFCSTFQLSPDQVAMVGDTRRDMEFGRNSKAGQVIFVRASFPDPVIEAMADLVLEDVNQLLNNLPERT